jgi:hypothetical protein
MCHKIRCWARSLPNRSPRDQMNGEKKSPQSALGGEGTVTEEPAGTCEPSRFVKELLVSRSLFR